jgi:hypothetical protein
MIRFAVATLLLPALLASTAVAEPLPAGWQTGENGS